ncbi:hypothetical protein ACHMW6_16740 [Pseudoduganella sp. UC29_106]|uniref:hypothetical protein n=1 Tax=Pseudoduganella sp. UC29_106 TaxID=3374553 RepID=UPI0037571BCB
MSWLFANILLPLFAPTGVCGAAVCELENSGWVAALLIFLLILSCLLASGGALFHTSLVVSPSASWLGHFRCMIASLVVTTLSATTYAIVHFVKI